MISPELNIYLQRQENAALLQPPAYLSGLIFGVSAAPEIQMPEVWMPWTLSPSARTLSESHVADLTAVLMEQLRWQLDLMRHEQISLPTECRWHTEQAHRQSLELWFTGLTFAHQQCEPSWQLAWDKSEVQEATSRLTRCLKCFSIFADVNGAIASSPEHKRQSFIDNLPVLAAQLTPLLQDYVKLAGQLAGTLPGQFELTPHQ